MFKTGLQLFAEAVSGKKIVYLYRLAGKAKEEAAKNLAFTTENGEDMQKILCMFRNIYVENTECPIPKMDYTRGHFKRGVK